MPLVPFWFLKEFLKITEIKDEFEKAIYCKYLIYSLPKQNRNVLDSIAQFFALIQFLIGDMEGKPVNMDMHGFAVVMMPKIFIKQELNLDLEDINKLIAVLEYILEERHILFSVGVEEKEENGIYHIKYYDLGMGASHKYKDDTEESQYDDVIDQ